MVSFLMFEETDITIALIGMMKPGEAYYICIKNSEILDCSQLNLIGSLIKRRLLM